MLKQASNKKCCNSHFFFPKLVNYISTTENNIPPLPQHNLSMNVCVRVYNGSINVFTSATNKSFLPGAIFIHYSNIKVLKATDTTYIIKLFPISTPAPIQTPATPNFQKAKPSLSYWIWYRPNTITSTQTPITRSSHRHCHPILIPSINQELYNSRFFHHRCIQTRYRTSKTRSRQVFF